MDDETELEMVRRHVREGARHVTRQGELIAALQEQGAPTAMAIAMLETFEASQRQHKAHLARLEADPPEVP